MFLCVSLMLFVCGANKGKELEHSVEEECEELMLRWKDNVDGYSSDLLHL